MTTTVLGIRVSAAALCLATTLYHHAITKIAMSRSVATDW
jgi:hypothetical protein